GTVLHNCKFRGTPDEYLVYFGRSTEGKGPLQAIEVGKRMGMRLLMAAPESGYYYDEVEQHVDGKQIVYLGELGQQEKVELLGGARAMIYPMQIGEPFGLVLIEAMACGTPVAALNMGAAPEIVIDGLSGYVSDTLDEMVAKLPDVMALPRRPIRRYAEEHYSAEAMTDGYEALYYRLVAEREARESNPFTGGELGQDEYAFSDLRSSR